MSEKKCDCYSGNLVIFTVTIVYVSDTDTAVNVEDCQVNASWFIVKLFQCDDNESKDCMSIPQTECTERICPIIHIRLMLQELMRHDTHVNK